MKPTLCRIRKVVFVVMNGPDPIMVDRKRGRKEGMLGRKAGREGREEWRNIVRRGNNNNNSRFLKTHKTIISMLFTIR